MLIFILAIVVGLVLVVASNFFGAAFSRLDTPTMLTEFMLTLDMSPYFLLFIIMALIFLIGWPLEWMPILLALLRAVSMNISILQKFKILIFREDGSK